MRLPLYGDILDLHLCLFDRLDLHYMLLNGLRNEVGFEYLLIVLGPDFFYRNHCYSLLVVSIIASIGVIRYSPLTLFGLFEATDVCIGLDVGVGDTVSGVRIVRMGWVVGVGVDRIRTIL